MRFLVPWLVSGACHVGRTDALRHIMQCHSLFFQGNDVETGLLGEQLGYHVTHIPFVVNTDVPAHFKGWWRQRLAWSGGEFRLFIANFRYIFKHPFLWAYGAIITIALVGFRWFSITSPALVLIGVGLLYYVIIIWLQWKYRNWWLLLMPIYSLFSSLIITPIGIVWYFVMAVPEKNFGIIRAKERLSSS
jgi:cellulose synthase/poly-beta-1,6-N-acetylglucosamine synthase-like glycosyltransferase